MGMSLGSKMCGGAEVRRFVQPRMLRRAFMAACSSVGSLLSHDSENLREQHVDVPEEHQAVH